MQNHPILAAIDMDANAEGIIHHALQLAVICNSPLIVTHVVNYQAGLEIDHIPLHTPAQIITAMRQTAQDWILNELQRRGARATVIVEYGRIRDNIIDLAEEFDVGYIIIGTPASFLSSIGNLPAEPRLTNAHRYVLTVAHQHNNWRWKLTKIIFNSSWFKRGYFSKCKLY